MKLFITELRKLRRRHIGLLYAATLAVIWAWALWAMNDMDKVIMYQGYYYLLLSLPLMNGIFLPTILAAVECRLCDMEIRGNTLKMLCTMESRQSLFHTKLLVGALYLFLFTLAETLTIPFLGKLFQIKQALPVSNVVLFFVSTFGVSLVLMMLQQTLSLLWENQLFPLFFGVGGSFAGIFSWFFPQLPLRYVLPSGYYCVGTTINLYYEEMSRTVTYYPIPFPTGFFLGFGIFGILVCLTGRRLFLKKEI